MERATSVGNATYMILEARELRACQAKPNEPPHKAHVKCMDCHGYFCRDHLFHKHYPSPKEYTVP